MTQQKLPSHSYRRPLNPLAEGAIQFPSLSEAMPALLGMENEAEGLYRDGRFILDRINLGLGEKIEVTGLSCKVIAGSTPTACPDARPALAPPYLRVAEAVIKKWCALPERTTIHWVGHDTGHRSRCRCHPNAPYAAPFDQTRWQSVASPPSNSGLINKIADKSDLREGTGTKSTDTASAAGGNRTESPCFIHWEGKRHKVSKGVIFDLIEYMWTREQVGYHFLTDAVFGGAVSDGSIGKRTSEVNRHLRDIGIPWKLSSNSLERMVTKHFENDSGTQE